MRYPSIERHAGLFSDYTELRVQENREANVLVVNGDVQRNLRSTSGGVSARVFKDGVWGFASNPTVSDATIARAVQVATDNARFLSSRDRRGGRAIPVTRSSTTHDLSTRKPRMGQNGLIDFARAIDAYCLAKHPDLSSRSVFLGTLDVEKSLFTSDGADAYSAVPGTALVVMLNLERKGETIGLWQFYGGVGQFEELFDGPESVYPKIDDLHDHLIRKAEGVYPRAGLHDVVLGPDLTGLLAHEAVGHTVEADLVLGGSVAADHLDAMVASELVTLVDFANTALQEPCPVPVWTDDEGTPAEDAVLIEKGLLRSYMHNKQSAHHFGVAPTGNARAAQFSDEPLIRMRNTAILPGSSTLAELIASIDDGYYFTEGSNGQADSTGEFMFGVIRGCEIKHGKLGRAIRDTTISGVAFDMLKTVTMVSGEMSWIRGLCGKKQLIPVGMGGPAIRCKITVGGR
jgi:TldD protein